MKKLSYALVLSGLFLTTSVFASTTNGDEKGKTEIKTASQQVRFYNKCSSSVDFYVKGSGGTTRYSVSANSSKNVGVSVGDDILDSSRSKITTISSSDSKVTVCD